MNRKNLLSISVITLIGLYFSGCGGDKLSALRRKAEHGDAIAQYELGIHYYKGDEVSQDYQEAVKWSRKAAEQGNADAQLMLGMCYEDGLGVKQNDQEAVKWYRGAADQGNANAQLMLRLRDGLGQGVEQDYQGTAKTGEQGEVDTPVLEGDSYEDVISKMGSPPIDSIGKAGRFVIYDKAEFLLESNVVKRVRYFTTEEIEARNNTARITDNESARIDQIYEAKRQNEQRDINARKQREAEAQACYDAGYKAGFKIGSYHAEIRRPRRVEWAQKMGRIDGKSYRNPEMYAIGFLKGYNEGWYSLR